MGLDMYAYSTAKENVVDLNELEIRIKLNDNCTQIAYWRKFNNLHGWMEKLYISKGGKESFNCIQLLLTDEDLDELLADSKHPSTMPPTPGFFFGSINPLTEKDQQDIAEFIAEAKNEILDGKNIVFYSSDW